MNIHGFDRTTQGQLSIYPVLNMTSIYRVSQKTFLRNFKKDWMIFSKTVFVDDLVF